MNRKPAFIPLVGVLGGLGPLSTVDFYRKLTIQASAVSDQEHVPLLIASIPQIPDLVDAYSMSGPSPIPALFDCVDRLIAGGCSLLVLPCNTVHIWYEEIRKRAGVDCLHIVDEALACSVKGMAGSAPRIGLLGTRATIQSGIYTGRNTDIHWLLPNDEELDTLVHPAIYAVKRGELEQGRELARRAAEALAHRGADAVILGCTELPVVLDARNSGIAFIDPTDTLARAVLRWWEANR
ncbi:amino acid racemase [Nostoc sp. CHAB 5834]|nr:amino acid racemase [Nostoc sp. CHAB 5834]